MPLPGRYGPPPVPPPEPSPMPDPSPSPSPTPLPVPTPPPSPGPRDGASAGDCSSAPGLRLVVGGDRHDRRFNWRQRFRLHLRRLGLRRRRSWLRDHRRLAYGQRAVDVARALALCLWRRQFLLETAATAAPAGSRQREDRQAASSPGAPTRSPRRRDAWPRPKRRGQHNGGDQPGMKAARQRQGPLDKRAADSVRALNIGSAVEIARSALRLRDRAAPDGAARASGLGLRQPRGAVAGRQRANRAGFDPRGDLDLGGARGSRQVVASRTPRETWCR